jgi:hypothetical protein
MRDHYSDIKLSVTSLKHFDGPAKAESCCGQEVMKILGGEEFAGCRVLAAS